MLIKEMTGLKSMNNDRILDFDFAKPMAYVDGVNLYQFELSDPIVGLDPLGLADQPQPIKNDKYGWKYTPGQSAGKLEKPKIDSGGANGTVSVETGGSADMGVDDQGNEIINKNTIKIKFIGKGCKHAHWVQYISHNITYNGVKFISTYKGPKIDVNGTDTQLMWKYGKFYVDTPTTSTPYVDLSPTGTNSDGESSNFDQPKTQMPWDKINVPVSEVFTVHDYLVADDGTVLYELEWTLTYDNDHHDGTYGSITGNPTNQFNEGDGANPASFYAGDNEAGDKIVVPNPHQKK